MKVLAIARLVGGTSAALLAAAAQAQPYDLSWNTIDGGGAQSSGGIYVLTGTAGQPDAGSALAGVYKLASGFWSVFVPDTCYVNCDGSTAAPILNANDFQCFLNKYAAADPYANCDGTTNNPVLTTNDFQCFLNLFAVGCT